jgi:hypothetical protein
MKLALLLLLVNAARAEEQRLAREQAERDAVARREAERLQREADEPSFVAIYQFERVE